MAPSRPDSGDHATNQKRNDPSIYEWVGCDWLSWPHRQMIQVTNGMIGALGSQRRMVAVRVVRAPTWARCTSDASVPERGSDGPARALWCWAADARWPFSSINILTMVDPVVLASARTHGMADDDMLHAYRNPA